MSDWIRPTLKSIGSSAIVEYIGPYGAGKTTRLTRDKRELQSHHVQLVDREDFRGFVSGYTQSQKAFLFFLGFPLYLPALVLLFVESRGAVISDRVRRCHLVAMKSIYFRRFMGYNKKIFLSDEGLLHSCCPLFTGTSRVPSAWLLKLLYWRLSPVFLRVEVEEIQNIKSLAQREQVPINVGRRNCNDLWCRRFVDMIKSGDFSDIQFLVRESRRFYQAVTPVVNRNWPTLHTFPFEEPTR
ncbi:hypothetical protein [Thioalkalivibrio sp. ALJ24]|uniref:hypothetical protein n=1 Tax=Thioalkalivibrio sp. ALJ24 TaxID=545276 RepID=UPI0012E9F83E|nr:hypothetical protein [Thioalkalivibrio sp. ALJ24]